MSPRTNTKVTYLTPTEQKALRILMEGNTNKQIAQEMGLTEDTVKAHLYNIMIKKGMSNRLELVMAALGHPEWFGNFCSKCGRPL